MPSHKIPSKKHKNLYPPYKILKIFRPPFAKTTDLVAIVRSHKGTLPRQIWTRELSGRDDTPELIVVNRAEPPAKTQRHTYSKGMSIFLNTCAICSIRLMWPLHMALYSTACLCSRTLLHSACMSPLLQKQSFKSIFP